MYVDAKSAYRTGAVSITPASIGLDNVNNTSDMNKPVSTPVQTALNGKSDTNHLHDSRYMLNWFTMFERYGRSANTWYKNTTGKMWFVAMSRAKQNVFITIMGPDGGDSWNVGAHYDLSNGEGAGTVYAFVPPNWSWKFGEGNGKFGTTAVMYGF